MLIHWSFIFISKTMSLKTLKTAETSLNENFPNPHFYVGERFLIQETLRQLILTVTPT